MVVSMTIINIVFQRTHVEVVLELDRALAAKVDFTQDAVGPLLGAGVAHLAHGMQQVGSRDAGVVVKVKGLELRAQVRDLVRGELRPGKQRTVRLRHAEGLDRSLGLDHIAELDLCLGLQNLVSDDHRSEQDERKRHTS